MKHTFHCDSCGRNLHYECGFTTGYGRDPDDDTKHCYACCADRDIECMRERGRIALYLTKNNGRWRVVNWPSSLVFDNNGRGLYVKEGRHNMASVRYDTWFVGPDGFWWWGVRYGDNTEVVHCKRTKDGR